MKSLFACVAAGVLTLSAVSTANAQVLWGSGYYYNPWTASGVYGSGVVNPWTGGMYYGGAAYNPWTGYSSGSAGYNPWLGSYYSGGSFVNPYTGNWGYSQNYYNPWTGRFGYRYRFR